MTTAHSTTIPSPFERWTRLARGIRTIRTEHTLLRDLPRPAASAGLEWIGPHTIDGRQHDALRVASPSRITWTAFAVGGTRLRAWCAVPSDGRREFRIVVECGERQWQATRRVSADEGWRLLTLVLPATLTGELAITLEVRAGEGEGAPSLWGDPAFMRRRPATAVVRDALMGLRLLGLKGTIRRAMAAGRERADDARYRAWLANEASARNRSPIGGAAPGEAPLVSVLTPVFNTEGAWLRRCIESIRRQTYENWEMVLSDDGSTNPVTRQVLDAAPRTDARIRVVRAERNAGIVTASNLALDAARGAFVAFVDSDDELHPEALEEVARQIAARPDLDVIYSDEDKISPSGVRSRPHFKPDWSPDLLRSCMYVSHLTVMRRTLAVESGGFRPEYEGSQDYDLMLRATERTDRIAHIPRVLYSWRMAPESGAATPFAKPWAIDAARRALEDALTREGRRGRVAQGPAMGHFRVRYAIEGTPRVSVLLCAADSSTGREADAAGRAVAASAAAHRVEILIARDDGEPFGARVNRLARSAAGDHLLLLDPAARPFERGWIDALLELAQLPDVGAAGAVLLRRDGTIEHAGIVLGLHRFAGCAFRGEPAWTRGHLANAVDIRNCSAVSTACLLTRRQAFETAGGLDARLGRGAATIDYGLRLRQAGLRIVITPYARLRYDGSPILADVTAEERQWLRERWGSGLDADPYYNANFDRDAATFRLPPRPLTGVSS